MPNQLSALTRKFIRWGINRRAAIEEARRVVQQRYEKSKRMLTLSPAELAKRRAYKRKWMVEYRQRERSSKR